ncbi:MAG TPA: A/G-specific adenine glycosylase [Phycisphaerales bacterium]|nr:A/G-specific adenine glycosylase [Phycisphaerales bacterium]HMP35903.1 A/G-specific adenine glycosylase [Phycisphaerales bacterium]
MTAKSRTRAARKPPASPAGSSPDPVDPRLIAAKLEDWFKSAARDLPWRGSGRSPYAALVSEAMLQQTQVARVIAPFVGFMRRFPTLESLASADEESVLSAWRGLGYYRRARNLHAAARRIIAEHCGAVPEDVASLRQLPGVGRYTAGSIASLVFGRREPIVDGNVSRVLLRIHGADLDPGAPATDAWTWEQARRLVDAAGDPAVLNEGLMELGALVCVPASPRCERCPLCEPCAARAAGSVERIPRPRRAPARTAVVHHVVIVRRRGRLLVERRPATGLWAGLWQPPTVESTRRIAPDRVAAALRIRLERIERVASFVHLTTHREVRVVVHRADLGATSAAPDEETARPRRWIGRRELDSIAMSNAALRAIALAEARGDGARGE